MVVYPFVMLVFWRGCKICGALLILGLRLASKEEMKSWDGILDERFQDNFRVRCRATWGNVEIGWLVGFLTGSWICELILDTFLVT